MPTLHVVIPVFNERGTLEACIERILRASLFDGWSRRIVLIDDGSDVQHFPAVAKLVDWMKAENAPLAFHRHNVNQGKGAALQTGFDAILSAEPAPPENDLVIIQDADLEYDPNDYSSLMLPLLNDKADAVLGTRWGEHYTHTRMKHRAHALGNRMLTGLSNLMTGFDVHDVECCYKVFSVGLLRRMRPMLSERRFGIEPQMVAALSRLGARVVEVPVRYDPRGFASGKKIGWKDAVRAIVVIGREKWRRPRASDQMEPRSARGGAQRSAS